MFLPPVPYPNNELGPQVPPPTGSYPINVDYAISSSYSETSSYLLGFISSASYANFAATASYLLGSIANAVSASWAQFAGHSLTAESASWADNAGTASYVLSASYAQTASYVGLVTSASYAITSSVSSTSISSSYALTASYALNGGGVASVSSSYLSGSSATVQRLTLTNPFAGSYMVSQYATDVEYATPVDQFPDIDGNSAKWLISINDGASYKTSEIISIWDPTTNVTNFAEVTTNVIGNVPVAMSVNISGDNVRLVANPASGSWTIKSLRFVL